MKLNKLISLVLVSTMCLPFTTVKASDDYVALFDITQTQNANGRLISVEIKGFAPNADIDTLLLFPEKVNGVDVMADGDINATEMAQVLHADENYLRTPNKVYRFYMPDSAPNGVYTLIAGGNTPEGALKNRSHKFYYCADASASNAFITTNALTSANLEAGLSNGYFYIDITNPAYVQNKDAVAKLVDDLDPQDQFELEEAFRLACDFVNSQGMDSYKLDAYMNIRQAELGLDTANADYLAYPENTKRIFKDILDNASGTDEVISLADLRHTFTEACAVNAIDKETDALTIVEKLKAYNSTVFHLNFDSDDYKKVYAYDVGKEFVDNNYNSVAEIVGAFNARVSYLASAAPSTGGDNGGGGGGGGVVAPTPTDTEKFDNLTENLPIFADVSNSHWANTYVEFCYKNNIMTGDDSANFRPDDSITRKEFVKTILAAFAIETEGAECEFTDVSKDDWAYPYISKAYEMGVSNGVTDETYGPEMNITRQDAVTMIFRIVKMAREDRDYKEAAIDFTDNDDIADYALEGVKVLWGEGVIGGYDDGSFMPNKTITRAETAKIIKVLLDIVG